MRGKPASFAANLALLVGASLVIAQNDTKPTVSTQPLTSEQLAVYRAVLGDWMPNEMPTMNLSIQTVPLKANEPSGDKDCAKGLDLEPVAPTIVHQFRDADLAQLSSPRIVLVDPERGRKDAEDNDPEKTIGNGSSIEDAVRNGFARGLATLSEIQFDKNHTHAIVAYSFYSGQLCGNGGTVVLEKTDAGWRRKSRCHVWISLAAPAENSAVLAGLT